MKCAICSTTANLHLTRPQILPVAVSEPVSKCSSKLVADTDGWLTGWLTGRVSTADCRQPQSGRQLAGQ
ncbi:unnamed protein product, partial [Ceratitis capitata]